MLITRRDRPMLKRCNVERVKKRELSDAQVKAAAEARSDERRRIERELTVYHRAPDPRSGAYQRPYLLNHEPAQPYQRIALLEREGIDVFSEAARHYVPLSVDVVTFRSVRKVWASGNGVTVCWWDWELLR